MADEVRKLAEVSSKSTKEIFQLIQEVRSEINNADISEENNAAASEVASNIDKQTLALTRLTEMTNELNEISVHLKAKLSKIKLV